MVAQAGLHRLPAPTRAYHRATNSAARLALRVHAIMAASAAITSHGIHLYHKTGILAIIWDARKKTNRHIVEGLGV